MIRTSLVKLTVIPAVAYRQKLTSGGSGIVIVRGDSKQPGIASISKTGGNAIPTANTPVKKFPAEAFQEAMELTAGLAYRKLGAVHYEESKVEEEKPAAEEPELKEVAVVVSGKDYKEVVKKYSDKAGRLSYDLLNRDLIKFLHVSSRARTMIAEKESEKAIRDYVTGSKFRSVTKNRKLTDAQVALISELLDEVSPKGVYKELNAEIRSLLKAAKKA